MRKRSRILATLLLAMALVQVALAAQAAPLKVFIAEFKVTGAANRDELKVTLPGLLASRLTGNEVSLVDAVEGADLTVAGTYISFGKVFSLDVLLKDMAGKVVGRAFEQGDSLDEIIPAVTKLAQKLNADLAKLPKVESPVAPAATQVAPVAQPVPSPAAPAPKIQAVVPTIVVPPTPQTTGDIIRPDNLARAGESGMIGQRLDGVMLGMARGKTLPNGEREIVVAMERELRLYRQGAGLTLVTTENGFNANDKILGIDALAPANEGPIELYVTLMRGEELDSQVWIIEEGKFRLVAEKLPYFFRAISVRGGERRIFAQQMGRDADFYGDVYEVAKQDGKYEIKNPRKLPRGANVFNWNMFAEKDGKLRSVLINADGYLTVCGEGGEELWRSAEKFGGSELYFSREDQQNVRVTGEQFRKIFLEQRITVTKDGEIVVPRNDGFWVVGNSRSFTKNSVYDFVWNGAVLEERWHTKPSQNYLSDYFYDEARKELVVLEVIKKAGMIEKGASAISAKRVQ